ncbi:unnamed protein product [Gongylonema pulchrum]|uniref:Myosin_tail_1 domain-containing protein n=1 Tax=Gongylonema pulchrum TaxID=637853 RepID=A0A183EJ60_9BILA|nr:unnamed protein product [Gongylonema pulchrum]
MNRHCLAANVLSEDSAGEYVTPDTAELRRKTAQLEQALFLKNEELNEASQMLSKVTEKSNMHKKENEVLLRERNKHLAALRDLETERDNIALTKNECERRAEMLEHQKKDFEAKIDRLIHEKSVAASDLELQKNETAKMMEKIVLLETKLDDSVKEKRKIEIRYTGELQAELTSVTDKYESAMADVNKLSSSLADREAEIVHLNERIKKVLEEGSEKLSKAEEELLAGERLTSIYKEASEDAEKNLRQLNEDFEHRGRLLEQSKNGSIIVLSHVSKISQFCFLFLVKPNKIAETARTVIIGNWWYR